MDAPPETKQVLGEEQAKDLGAVGPAVPQAPRVQAGAALASGKLGEHRTIEAAANQAAIVPSGQEGQALSARETEAAASGPEGLSERLNAMLTVHALGDGRQEIADAHSNGQQYQSGPSPPSSGTDLIAALQHLLTGANTALASQDQVDEHPTDTSEKEQ